MTSPYWFSEAIRRLADQISCECDIHQKIKSELYEIADRAEKSFKNYEHAGKYRI